MKPHRLSRIGIAGGAALLCLGVSVPAYAHGGTGDSGTRDAGMRALYQPSLQQEQTWVASFVTHRTAWLEHVAAQVRADGYLSAAQQSAALATIAKAESALQNLKSQVDAATSTAQVRDIMGRQVAALPFPLWPHPGLRRHAVAKRDFAEAAALAGRRKAADKTAQHAAAPANGVETVAFRTADPSAREGNCDHGAWASPTDVATRTAGYRWAAARHAYRAGGDQRMGRGGRDGWGGDHGDGAGYGGWGR